MLLRDYLCVIDYFGTHPSLHYGESTCIAYATITHPSAFRASFISDKLEYTLRFSWLRFSDVQCLKSSHDDTDRMSPTDSVPGILEIC